MKLLFSILLSFLILSFPETQAQRSDSTGTTLLMKRKSKVFIAEVETKLGIQKGILYEADSSRIVILDTLYQRFIIPINEMKSLKIYRSNSELYGAKIGFLIPSIPFTAIGILFFVSSGTITNGFTTAFLVSGLAGGVIFGLLLAIINPLIPHTNIKNTANFSEEYHKQLRYLKLKTQQNIIQRHPNKVRSINNYSAK